MIKSFRRFLADIIAPEDSLRIRGEVSLHFSDGREIFLGENLVLPKYREHIAKLMASPDYVNQHAWPTGIWVGSGATSVSIDQEELVQPYYPKSAAILPIDGVSVVADQGEHSVTFSATLPEDMQVLVDQGGVEIGEADFVVEEWGLISQVASGGGENIELLARKVRNFHKEPSTTVEVRWKIYI